MIEAMIDLETLDTGPRAVVLSVGATLFMGPAEVGSFYYTLELDPQLRAGRTVSQATLLWWLEQGEAARSAAFSRDRQDPVEVLTALREFLCMVDTVWANGPAFDCVLWETLCNDFCATPPWRYNATRDMRTLREESGMPRDWAPRDYDGSLAHHPVADCRFQVAVVREARRRIGA